MIPCVRRLPVSWLSISWLSISAALLLLTACGHPPEKYVLPDEVMDFATLYAGNCAGCHGQDGQHGAARPLNDGLYLALVGKETLRTVIANGLKDTAMAPFAQEKGGTLTDRQISVLADEIQTKWGDRSGVDTAAMPAYAATLGDVNGGADAFRQYCASCHGVSGTGIAGRKGGSVVDPMYLALVSDQSLRTMVIAGRSDEHIPNWHTYIAGRAMTAQEISDVVAWVASHRTLPEDR